MKKLLSIIAATTIIAVFFYSALWKEESYTLYEKIQGTGTIFLVQLVVAIVIYAIGETKNREDSFSYLEKQGNPNPYSGTSFKFDGHTWGMCARDGGVDIIIDKELKAHVSVDDKISRWSEEDEKMLDKVIEDIVKLAGPYVCYRTDVEWLKSLKERLQPQQEWSEEDDELYNDLSDTYFYNDEDYPEETYKLMLKRVLDWMTKRAKSLRPQSTWKPSEEMLEALYRVIPENVMEKSEDEMLLDNLYQGLKYGKVLSEKVKDCRKS